MDPQKTFRARPLMFWLHFTSFNLLSIYHFATMPWFLFKILFTCLCGILTQTIESSDFNNTPQTLKVITNEIPFLKYLGSKNKSEKGSFSYWVNVLCLWNATATKVVSVKTCYLRHPTPREWAILKAKVMWQLLT